MLKTNMTKTMTTEKAVTVIANTFRPFCGHNGSIRHANFIKRNKKIFKQHQIVG